MGIIDTVEYKGCTIEIYPDYDASDPIKDYGYGVEYVGFMRDDKTNKRFKEPNDVMAYAKRTGGIAFPVRGYSHSGVGFAVYGTLRALQYPFTCPWDSGFAGVLLFEKTYIQEYFPGFKRLTASRRAKLLESAASWMEAYELWRGDGYVRYVVTDANGEVIDSLCGIDDQGYAISKAKSAIDDHLKEEAA